MADINVRDVNDEVKAITEELARREALSTSAYIRKLLEVNAESERRRRAMLSADQRLQRIREEMGLGHVDAGDIVREIRDEYEQAGQST